MRARFWMSLVFVLLGAAVFAVPQKGKKAEEKPKPPPFPPQAKSAIAIEEKSGRVLFEKDADARRFPASTTKILTALLLLEKTKPTDVIVAPSDVETVGGASLHLKPGERMTASEMLYALMLRSANDGCYAVAKHISGSVEAFSKLMNDRAKAIGCTKTNFHNPHGLNDPLHSTSARDLALMAREAMKRPEFRRVVSTRKYKVARSLNTEDQWLISKNRRLANDPTADGIKTGYTEPAGHCYVGSATRNGFRVITVVLASPDWQAEHAALLDYAFKNYARTQIEAPGQQPRSLAVELGDKETVSAVLAEPVFYANRKGERPEVLTEVIPNDYLAAPIRKGDPVGRVEYSDVTGWRFSAPLLAAEDVAYREPSLAAELFEATWPFMICAGALVATGLAIGGTALITRRRRFKSVP